MNTTTSTVAKSEHKEELDDVNCVNRIAILDMRLQPDKHDVHELH